MSFNDNLSPNSEHYQCTKAVFFFKIILFLSSGTILHPEKCQLLHKHLKSGLTYIKVRLFCNENSCYIYISSITKDIEEISIYGIPTYNTCLKHCIWFIQSHFWKKFQLRMVLDYIQHTRILKMLHFTIFIWYILHIMNTIFLLVQYTPKRLKCICLLNNYPNNFAFC